MKKVVNTYTFHIVWIAIAYFAVARLGLMLAYPETNATPIWLPTGIALSAVLLLGNRIWPGIALGAFIANFEQLAGLGLSIPVSLAASFSTSAGNTLEALAGAYLIHRYTGSRDPFERGVDVLAFIAFGALISTTVSATIGTTTFCLSISEWKNFVPIWLIWWLGDAVGAIVLVPLVITYRGFEAAVLKFRPMAGNLFLVISIIAVSYIVFFLNYPLDFLLLPFLLISVFRLGQFGSAIAIFVISGLSIYGTVNGTGPFVAQTQTESLLLQQGFIGSIAIATMILAAMVSEQKRSEPKLRESEERFRSAFEQAAVGIVFVAPDGKWLRVNQKLCDIVGYAKDDLMRKTLQDITFAEDLETDLEYVRRMLAGEIETYSMEKRYIGKDSSIIWINLTVSLIREPSGEPKYFISVIEDISTRKKAEKKLQESELFSKKIMESSINGIYIYDLEKKTNVYINRQYTNLTGYTLERINTMAAEAFFGLFHPEDQPRIATHMEDLSRAPDSAILEIEYRFKRADGGWMWCLSWDSVFERDDKGRIRQFIGMFLDITRHKKTEEVLKTRLYLSEYADSHSEEELLQVTLDEVERLTGSAIGFFHYVDDDQITLHLTMWSTNTLQTMCTAERKGSHYPISDAGVWVDCVHERRPVIHNDYEALPHKKSLPHGHAPVVRELVVPIIHAEKVWAIIGVGNKANDYDDSDMEIVSAISYMAWDIVLRNKAEEKLNKHRDHLEELVRDRTKDLEDAQKALLNLLEDISEAKDSLEKANERLKELDRLKSMFIASMSHELRTPLNSIIGFTGIMLQGLAGDVNDEQRDQLGRVKRAGQHLLALITDVIDVSKIEAGKIAVHNEVCNLAGMIGEAASAIKPEAEQKGLALEISSPQDASLVTDRRRLLQCVLNLLSNAVKYTEKGAISVSVYEDGDQVEIRVIDTGIGIAEADLPLLFNSFVRLESPLKTKTDGTGLGLYLTKKIATELLGGDVFVESRFGEGSVFGIRIPMDLTMDEKKKAA